LKNVKKNWPHELKRATTTIKMKVTKVRAKPKWCGYGKPMYLLISKLIQLHCFTLHDTIWIKQSVCHSSVGVLVA